MNAQNDTLFTYYPTGELRSTYPQKDSLNLKEWYDNGNIKSKTKINKKVECYFEWDEKGNITTEIN